jgi:hypothetical protein
MGYRRAQATSPDGNWEGKDGGRASQSKMFCFFKLTGWLVGWWVKGASASLAICTCIKFDLKKLTVPHPVRFTLIPP